MDEEEEYDEYEEEVVEEGEGELEYEEQEADADTPTKRKRACNSRSKRRKPRGIDMCAQQKTFVCSSYLFWNVYILFKKLFLRPWVHGHTTSPWTQPGSMDLPPNPCTHPGSMDLLPTPPVLKCSSKVVFVSAWKDHCVAISEHCRKDRLLDPPWVHGPTTPPLFPPWVHGPTTKSICLQML